MHGSEDDIVPYRHSEILFEAASHPKRHSPFHGCDHRNVTFQNPEYFSNTIKEFLGELLTETDSGFIG